MSVIPFRFFLSPRPSVRGNPVSRIFLIVLIFLLFMTGPCPAATILLDPGHGGDDKGAKSGGAYFENQYTLALAQKIAPLLGPDHKVVLTRTADVTLSADDRAGAANHLKADLMIGLHAAVTPYCGDRQAAVYFFDDSRLVLAPGISTGGQIGRSGSDHPNWERLQAGHQRQSQQLATLIKQSLLEEGRFDNVTVSGVPLVSLMGADLPAVLIEVGCLHPSAAMPTSKTEREISAYAQPIANAIRSAVNGMQR